VSRRRPLGLVVLAERVFMCSGGLLLAFFLTAHLRGTLLSQFALWQFDSAHAAGLLQDPLTATVPSTVSDKDRVDFSLWAEKRIAAYRQSLFLKKDAPLAVLKIKRLQIEVPVFEGTDDLTLNRGAGHIPGTSDPGDSGNIGIAGHRDGFFRGLKDILPGDEIELVSSRKTFNYRVDQMEIVSPSDVGVLKPRALSSLTLVTCYPFYFLGDAPQRFIVHASVTSPPSPGSQETRSKNNSTIGKTIQ